MSFPQFLIYLLRRLFFPNNLRTMEWQMLRLLNKDRKVYGLKKLFMQEDLRFVARKHSKDMARQDYFEHENLNGQNHADRYEEARISDVVSGENLAKIGGYKFPTQRAEIGLMNSPGHRANILNKSYNCVGIGIHKSEKKVFYFTQNFAHRELIFTKAAPKSIRLRKTLKLHFKPVGASKNGIYRVLDEKHCIQEKTFQAKQQVNILQIRFPRAGYYTVQLFTGGLKDKSLKLSNEIKLYVRKGWF